MHMTICGLDHVPWTLRILLLISSIMNQALQISHHVINLIQIPPHPFWKVQHLQCSASIVASEAIEQPLVPPSYLVAQKGPSLYHGRTIISKWLMAHTSACTSMSETLAPCSLLPIMVPTPVPSVAMLTMAWAFAQEISLHHTLYIHTTPYNPTTWHTALASSNLLSLFPNLVHDLTYSSPIGNPPPLSKIFLP